VTQVETNGSTGGWVQGDAACPLEFTTQFTLNVIGVIYAFFFMVVIRVVFCLIWKMFNKCSKKRNR